MVKPSRQHTGKCEGCDTPVLPKSTYCRPCGAKVARAALLQRGPKGQCIRGHGLERSLGKANSCLDCASEDRESGKFYAASRRSWLKTRYGLTTDNIGEMLAECQGCCAICGEPFKGTGTYDVTGFDIDHSHETGKVRGLLCRQCNRGLGQFKDDIDRLLGAVEYLRSKK